VSQWSPRTIGFPAVRRGHRFRPQRRFVLLRPSPGPFESGSFPRASCPLRSLLAFLLRASRRFLPWGFFPLRGVPEVSTTRGLSHLPASFRPQVFSTSRRLSPPSASRASFIPQPRPGFPFRGLVSTRSLTDSSTAVPPCPCHRHTHQLPGCHTSMTELRGLAPRGGAILGVSG